MTDGNISMEEDTELRDLVAQTLENNGVLAKVRAELRASVFLALEEQESVMNTEPLLNKTVKQYLANSEGRLLFSLVKEFLEYFSLDYTISVYDPETYSGKEYSYVGRTKLCEELGIASDEPLLGAILRNNLRGAFHNLPQRDNGSNDDGNRAMETQCVSNNVGKSNFQEIRPKMLSKDSVSLSNDNDSSEKIESTSESTLKIPINVTITDKKKMNDTYNSNSTNCPVVCSNDSSGKNDDYTEIPEARKSPAGSEQTVLGSETLDELRDDRQLMNKTESLIKFDQSIIHGTGQDVNLNEENTKQNSINNTEIHNVNNFQNKKQSNSGKTLEKTVYFDEIIIDGRKDKVCPNNRGDSSLLGDLPPLTTKTTSIFGDLPNLNNKRTDMNDLKQLMDIGLGAEAIDDYEEDFVSSASGSANEQSPAKTPENRESPPKSRAKKEERALGSAQVSQSMRSDEISEEIEGTDEILSSTSCLDDVAPAKTISNVTSSIVGDHIEEV